MEQGRSRVIVRAHELGIPEAKALGHEWLGELHIILGISRTDSPARRALEAVGITQERLGLLSSGTLRVDHYP